jgi:uncharacterized metal-binding protein YceD (DUF177 family)
MQKRTFIPQDNHLAAQVKLSHIPQNNSETFELDQENCEWLKELLVELNERVSDKSEEEKLKETNLFAKLSIEKKYKQQYGEYVLTKCEINGQFVTECVKTLKPLSEFVNLRFQAGFVDQSLENSDEFAELTEFFVDNEIYELYFYEKGQVDLKETIHEQLYLNIDPYPKIETEGVPQ